MKCVGFKYIYFITDSFYRLLLMCTCVLSTALLFDSISVLVFSNVISDSKMTQTVHLHSVMNFSRKILSTGILKKMNTTAEKSCDQIC